jgi:hypothetical protein
MSPLAFMLASKLLPVGVIATTRMPINHRWLLHVYDWRFGVVDFFGWNHGKSGGSIVFLGPISFETDLSAPVVAGTAAGILVGALALAAFVIRCVKQIP